MEAREYKRCLFDIKSIKLHTARLSTGGGGWEWGNLDVLSLNIKGWAKLELKYLIHFDILRFENMNKNEDENHQIDMESLTVRSIDIYDGANPTIRIEYMFDQSDDSGNWWRGCKGETSSLKIVNKSMALYRPDEIRFYSMPIYSAGCQVYW